MFCGTGQAAVEFLGGLDVLILNHAVMDGFSFWHGSRDNVTLLRRVMEGTFTSLVELASDALPYLQLTNGSLGVVSALYSRLLPSPILVHLTAHINERLYALFLLLQPKLPSYLHT